MSLLLINKVYYLIINEVIISLIYAWLVPCVWKEHFIKINKIEVKISNNIKIFVIFTYRGLKMVEKGSLSNILSQMKEIKAEMNNTISPIQAPRVDKLSQSQDVKKTGFGDMLTSAINSVNDEKIKSGKLATAYQLGDPNVDLPQVMIQAQKSSVAFEAMTQVRNRLVKAYETVMSMGV